jgi:hypothetical protein
MALAFAGQAQTLGDVLNPSLDWTTGGAAAWVVDTNDTFNGQAVAYSGFIGFGQSNWVETTVSGQAVISFWWQVDTVSLSPFASLSFDIGGVYEIGIGGSGMYWQQCEFYVPPGAQTARWFLAVTLGPAQIAGWLADVSLSAPLAPAILTQPTNQSILAGATASFSVSASGTGPLSFQWQEKGSDLPGATATSWSITDAQPANSGEYTVVVSNMVGSVTSQVATLVVVPGPPTFTLQPVSEAVVLGSNATFTAAATGSMPMTWLWLANGQALAGATNASLALTNVQLSDAGSYMAVAANQAGTITSQVATLTVCAAPVVTQQPVSHAVPIFAPATFTAGALGVAPLTWQWYFNGDAVAGATTATLSVSNAAPPAYGNYWAVVTNSYGSATTAVASLSFSPVIAWGGNQFGQCRVSPEATNIVALTGGDGHVLALRADGTVTAWGTNIYSQQAEAPATATNVVGIAAGSGHGLAVRGDGTVVLWGVIIGDWTTNVPPQATNVVALALGTGAQHALALRADGTVVEWGNTNWGLPNVPITATNIVAVSAGAIHSLALRGDGTIVAWGDDSQGQTRIPVSASNVVAISSGWYHNLALRTDGTLVQWGTSYWANVGIVPANATNIVAFSCGGNHSLALREDGELLAWGDDENGQTRIPAWATNLAAVAGTGFNSLALTGEGPPLLSSALVSRSVLAGGSTYFRATAVGSLPLAYQWQLDGTNLPGATAALLVVSNAQPAQAGTYSVVVTNTLGAVTSPGALLTVLPEESVILPQSLTWTNGHFGFLAAGPAGLKWSLQASSNLADWVDIAVLTNGTGTMTFNAPATNSAQGFYRLLLAP